MNYFAIYLSLKKKSDINENVLYITGMGNLQFSANILNKSENFVMGTAVDHNQKLIMNLLKEAGHVVKIFLWSETVPNTKNNPI
mgnify:CR=1 FL=1